MDITKFLDKSNQKYQLKVIAPTHTYGTVYGLDSKYDFEVEYDEYDTISDWEYAVVVDRNILATFHNVFCKFEIHSIAAKSTQCCHPIFSF